MTVHSETNLEGESLISHEHYRNRDGSKIKPEQVRTILLNMQNCYKSKNIPNFNILSTNEIDKIVSKYQKDFDKNNGLDDYYSNNAEYNRVPVDYWPSIVQHDACLSTGLLGCSIPPSVPRVDDSITSTVVGGLLLVGVAVYGLFGCCRSRKNNEAKNEKIEAKSDLPNKKRNPRKH
ncbi:MAG: hypothetical protein ABI370_06735 [Gammaproteobacteria bacterium]